MQAQVLSCHVAVITIMRRILLREFAVQLNFRISWNRMPVQIAAQRWQNAKARPMKPRYVAYPKFCCLLLIQKASLNDFVLILIIALIMTTMMMMEMMEPSFGYSPDRSKKQRWFERHQLLCVFLAHVKTVVWRGLFINPMISRMIYRYI